MAAVYPRTCYKCGEVGHVADDCQQEERLTINVKPGHESNDCPDPKQNTAKQCYSCDVGHIQTECPNQAQRCQMLQLWSIWTHF